MDLSGISPILLLASLMVASTPILLAALGAEVRSIEIIAPLAPRSCPDPVRVAEKLLPAPVRRMS